MNFGAKQANDDSFSDTMTSMLRSGAVGGGIGATTGALASHGNPRAAALSGVAGVVLGGVSGHNQARHQQELESAALGKIASEHSQLQEAFEAGRAYARSLIEKGAALQEIDNLLGHAAAGVLTGTGKALQGLAGVGKGLEHYADKKMDKEIAGRLVGAAGLAVGGAAAMHELSKPKEQPAPGPFYAY